MPAPNPVFSNLGTTIFTVMSGLAERHGAINLGQGFPDTDGPLAIRQAAARALLDGPNQYAPMTGMTVLRDAIAAHALTHYDLAYDPADEVIVTSGATEALGAAILAVTRPGRQIVLIEPSYDSYRPIAEAVGAQIKSVRLAPPDWRLTEKDLRAAIGPDTAAVLINSPMNPVGRVFSRDELEVLAAVIGQTDAAVICDEVYEHLVFDGGAHVPLITLPGMRERTIRIGSAGKTFSLTGWKVGYIVAAPALIQRAVKAHQFMVFTTPPNLQHAVAYGLSKERAFFTDFTAGMQAKRDRLRGGLEAAGFAVAPCSGTYFINADIGSIGFQGDDADFCRDIIEKAGVAAIPMSAFYVTEPDTSTVRFCFAKPDPMLDEAIVRLKKRFG